MVDDYVTLKQGATTTGMLRDSPAIPILRVDYMPAIYSLLSA